MNKSQLTHVQAAEIKADADKLMSEQQRLMNDVRQQQVDAEEMLESGIREQQIADELLAEADAARDLARNAINKAEQTLKDANETLKTLRGKCVHQYLRLCLPFSVKNTK